MNLPPSFITRTSQLMGEDACRELCEALQHDTPVSIRINRNKCSMEIENARNIPWASDGYYLSCRPTFTFDPLFHAGSYYVQEASSMFVERAVRKYIDSPSVMLDLCAAPGGKSTLLRSSLPEGSILVANEVMRNRSQILAENIIKWGHPDVMVTNNDPADFTSLGPVFDAILTDVPCSGEGMFRKDEVAVEEWSPANVGLCWERQRRILRDIWPCLKPGGILIYSTCTFNREENEDNVAWIAKELGAEVLPVDIEEGWNITGNLVGNPSVNSSVIPVNESENPSENSVNPSDNPSGNGFPVYRFLPHKTEGEGLFLAVLRKDGYMEDIDDDIFSGIKPKKNKKPAKGKNDKNLRPAVFPGEIKGWVNASEDMEYLVDGSMAYMVSVKLNLLEMLMRSSIHNLNILHRGITVAEMKGKDWQPHHSLAMSIRLDKDSFPQAELSYEQAISYLRKEAVVLDSSVPKGYVLVTFNDIPLGFVKNIGNRANNLYPQEWRIRSGYLPEEIRMVF